MTTNPQLNRNVTLDEIARHVRQTADALFEGDQDAVSDHFIELYDLLFPDGSRPATAEEIAGLEMDPPANHLILKNGSDYKTAFHAFHAAYLQAEVLGSNPNQPPNQSSDYLILQDDDLTRTDRTESETLELLHEVQNQILDGEREPAAFLEALELMYRISRQYTAASEQAAQRAEQAEARLVQLMQQNQHLLGLLSLISKGADQCTPTYTN